MADINYVMVLGMMETVRIRRSGYPVRRVFDDFLFRYNVLGRVAGAAKVAEPKEKCVLILKKFEETPGSKDWQPGHTKVRKRGTIRWGVIYYHPLSFSLSH